MFCLQSSVDHFVTVVVYFVSPISENKYLLNTQYLVYYFLQAVPTDPPPPGLYMTL